MTWVWLSHSLAGIFKYKPRQNNPSLAHSFTKRWMPGNVYFKLRFPFTENARHIHIHHGKTREKNGVRSIYFGAWKTHLYTLFFLTVLHWLSSLGCRGVSLVFSWSGLCGKKWFSSFPKCFPPIFWCVVTRCFLCVVTSRLKCDIQLWLTRQWTSCFPDHFPRYQEYVNTMSDSIFVLADNAART